MLKAKKLLYVFSIGLVAASGCCLPSLPLCNECVHRVIQTLAAVIELTPNQ